MKKYRVSITFSNGKQYQFDTETNVLELKPVLILSSTKQNYVDDAQNVKG